ncbi:hypothetical protein IFM89_004798 [Coptis chinensis]|uniref:2-oxoglutarate-dependent dioxygenase DAO n=1 Tax=Coptis chinensis TaxID=261450 RepID=A0A835I9X0_9MAGN|nr:hypothetical protein IFM89_004798 [Coptis chinensis]
MDIMKVEREIPFLDLTKDPKDLEEGSDGWKCLSKKVREACEEYGCFQVKYNKLPTHLGEEMFKASKELFDLPDEIKVKNLNSKPYYGYIGKIDAVPLYESLGIEDATTVDGARTFAQQIWPDGNPVFCETVNSISNKLYDLELLVLKMVMQSFGAEKYYNSYVESNNTIVRVNGYKAPHSNDLQMALAPHTDNSSLTVLCQESQGLEVLSKEGEWLRVAPLPGAFVVFVGEALKAWSNARLHTAKHRVMTNGDRQRYSFGLFLAPKEGAVIEIPEELVDKEHPLLYRPFNYMDYLNYYASNLHMDNVLEVYAGV